MTTLNSHAQVVAADAHAPAAHASTHNVGGADATSANPQVTTIELGHASDTTIARASAGNLTVEGNALYRAGGTDVAVADGGTGSSTAADARTALGISATNTPFTPVGTIAATDVQAAIAEVASEAGAAAAAELLAVKFNVTGGNKASTSTTQADIDATNSVITFTAPASGNVLVRIQACINLSGGNQNSYLGIRESTTDVVSKLQAMQGLAASATEETVSWSALVTGISAGSHTYKAAFAVNGGITMTVRQAAASPLIMEVWAAP